MYTFLRINKNVVFKRKKKPVPPETPWMSSDKCIQPYKKHCNPALELTCRSSKAPVMGCWSFPTCPFSCNYCCTLFLPSFPFPECHKCNHAACCPLSMSLFTYCDECEIHLCWLCVQISNHFNTVRCKDLFFYWNWLCRCLKDTCRAEIYISS